jgi:hypothetical protein
VDGHGERGAMRRRSGTWYTTAAVLVLSTVILAGWLLEALERAHKTALCDPETVRAAHRIEERWAAQVLLTASTPRMTVAGPLAELQEIQRTYRDAPRTLCLYPVRESRLNEMAQTVSAFLHAMREDELPGLSKTEFKEAVADKQIADNAMLALRKELFPQEVAAEARAHEEQQRALDQRVEIEAKEAAQRVKDAEASEKAQLDAALVENRAAEKAAEEKVAAEQAAEKQQEAARAAEAARREELNLAWEKARRLTARRSSNITVGYHWQPRVVRRGSTLSVGGQLINNGDATGTVDVVVTLLRDGQPVETVRERITVPESVLTEDGQHFRRGPGIRAWTHEFQCPEDSCGGAWTVAVKLEPAGAE